MMDYMFLVISILCLGVVVGLLLLLYSMQQVLKEILEEVKNIKKISSRMDERLQTIVSNEILKEAVLKHIADQENMDVLIGPHGEKKLGHRDGRFE